MLTKRTHLGTISGKKSEGEGRKWEGRDWEGRKWEGKPVFQHNVLMDLSPVPEIRCDWNKDWDKQATNMLLTCFRHVSLPPGSLRRTELPAEQQPCLWALCWAESAESRKRRALPSTLHTPSNLCLGRESSAGNPPYVFLYYKELRRMSSFLFKHPHIAVKQPWLDD